MKSGFFPVSLALFLTVTLATALATYFNGYSPWWIALCLLGYTLLLAAGSASIRWNFYFRSVNMLPAMAGKKVALTFDDGPAAYTAQILDILKEEQVPATFFLIGKNIKGNSHLLARMTQEGHSIGNHSFEHGFNFDWQSSAKMLEEIEAANAAIKSVTGRQPVLFRPPYGVTNPNLARAVRSSGMTSIGWSLRSLDTVTHNEKRLLNRVLKKLRPGAIILLHDRCQVTAAILPRLIAAIKERGYECVRL